VTGNVLHAPMPQEPHASYLPLTPALTASPVSTSEGSIAGSTATFDVGLVVDAQAGSLRARQLLFDGHLDRTRRFASRLLGRDQDLNDVVQECMVSALESLDKLRNPKHFSSWLGGVLINTVRGTLVRRRRLTRFSLKLGELVPVETLSSRSILPDGAAELGRFLRVLEQLPDKQRAAWILRHVDGSTVAEIARKLCCAPSTVKRWLHAIEVRMGAARTGARRLPRR
jgi:RNA polymerase sigma-70 factor, ECF subfamily